MCELTLAVVHGFVFTKKSLHREIKLVFDFSHADYSEESDLRVISKNAETPLTERKSKMDKSFFFLYLYAHVHHKVTALSSNEPKSS